MVYALEWDRETGTILSVAMVLNPLTHTAREGADVVIAKDAVGVGFGSSDGYRLGQIVTERPPMEGVSIDGLTLRGVPDGALLTVGDSRFVISSGTAIDLTGVWDDPGTYPVTIKLFPYMDLTLSIEVLPT